MKKTCRCNNSYIYDPSYNYHLSNYPHKPLNSKSSGIIDHPCNNAVDTVYTNFSGSSGTVTITNDGDCTVTVEIFYGAGGDIIHVNYFSVVIQPDTTHVFGTIPILIAVVIRCNADSSNCASCNNNDIPNQCLVKYYIE